MESPSYYAIIPATVRYDKEITPNAKLLYGEITALCNKEGKCWASNNYFSELYGVSKVSISKWINQLIKNGYLNSEMEYKEGSKEILKRYLRIVNDPIKEKLKGGIKEKFKDNTTSINNTINIYSELFESLWKLYPLKRDKHKVSKKSKEAIVKIGFDKMKLAIERYVAECKSCNRYYKNGSTFFNGAYEDYVADDYEEVKKEGDMDILEFVKSAINDN